MYFDTDAHVRVKKIDDGARARTEFTLKPKKALNKCLKIDKYGE